MAGPKRGRREHRFPMASLVQGATAALRRHIAGAVAPVAPPTLVTDGRATQRAELLHIIVRLTGAAGQVVQWRLYTFDAISEGWSLDTRLGAVGTVTVAIPAAAVSITDRSIIESGSIDRVAIELLGFVGPPTVDVWLAES